MNRRQYRDTARLLATLDEPDADVLARLHTRLTTAADDAGLLDIAYRRLDTPVGPLLLAATTRGLVRVAYACEDHDMVLAALAKSISPRILHAPARLDIPAREIDDYFSGLRTRFELALDLRLAHGFRRQVLDHLRDIGYGATQTYAGVAVAVGNPNAVRAVGTACARNPLPVVIPCHRVVRSDGGVGGYAGGQHAKQTLLALEAAR